MFTLSSLKLVLELGMIYSFLSLGVFITFRILNIPDLSCDGTFVSGMVISAMLCTSGHPYASIPLAFIGGAFFGLVTGLLHTKLHIPAVLSGILVMSGLYSINLHLQNNVPNVTLYNTTTLLSNQRTLVLVIFTIVVILALNYIMNTYVGVGLRSLKNNKGFLTSLNQNPDVYICFGLALANGLVATSGALLSQYQSYSDTTSGTGMLVIGLASLVIGEAIGSHKSFLMHIISIALGAIIYRFIVSAAYQVGLNPNDIKLFSVILVIIALCFSSTYKGGMKNVQD